VQEVGVSKRHINIIYMHSANAYTCGAEGIENAVSNTRLLEDYIGNACGVFCYAMVRCARFMFWVEGLMGLRTAKSRL
jgi:hypothetical protein